MFDQTERELQIRSLIKTKTPKIETRRYPARDDTHFRRLFAVIRAYLDDLRSKRFVYRPGWTCAMCDFRENCTSQTPAPVTGPFYFIKKMRLKIWCQQSKKPLDC